MVCDFRQLGGSKLYVVNDFDDKRMKDVPMFCYSHLVMKLDIQPKYTVCARMMVQSKRRSRARTLPRWERICHDERACRTQACAGASLARPAQASNSAPPAVIPVEYVAPDNSKDLVINKVLTQAEYDAALAQAQVGGRVRKAAPFALTCC